MQVLYRLTLVFRAHIFRLVAKPSLKNELECGSHQIVQDVDDAAVLGITDVRLEFVSHLELQYTQRMVGHKETINSPDERSCRKLERA